MTRSRWYRLVNSVVQGRAVECRRGGKEVHVVDVARATLLLLQVRGWPARPSTAMTDMCRSTKWRNWPLSAPVAHPVLSGERTRPQHEIQTGKIRQLGMDFGGEPLLRQTISQMVQQIQQS